MTRPLRAPTVVLLVGGALAVLCAAIFMVARTYGHDVVVYTSADDGYCRPLVAAFERETGLKVGLVTDAEAAKTTGLYQRLLGERDRPGADVFWNNEISRTLLLSRKNVLQPFTPGDVVSIPSEFRDPRGRWYGLACRVRVLVCNTEKLAEKDLPGSIFDLVDERWKGKVAMAYPLFGTTATHCAALRAHKDMGREKTNDFLRRLVANDLQVVEGNRIVAMRVAAGSALVGFTDTDDAWAMIDEGRPVGIVYPDGRADEIGTLVIPNTASMVAGCRRPEGARRFLDFLLSDRAEEMLAAPPARHLPTRQRVKAHADATPLYMIRPMQADWEKVADEVEAQVRDLEEIFPR